MAAAQREVWTGSQLRRLLAEKAGLEMSAASVSALFAKEPSQVKLSTLAALCTALHSERPVRRRYHPGRAARRAREAPAGTGQGGVGPRPAPSADLRRPAWARSSGTAPHCGAPVGITGRQYCCLCERDLREAAAKAECPGCGKQRVLRDETGRCILCSRSCTGCGHPVRRKEDTLRRDCRRKARQSAAQRLCPRCGRPGYLREATGWCGPCSRPRQGKDPPRKCIQCGQVRRHEGLGRCSACCSAARTGRSSPAPA
jgi:predicted RNA-binding Zn-ribbon protein involved in translation (DUF1610 family)